MEVITKRGAVKCVCEVCGKDRNRGMSHEWNGDRWYDYCYLHWRKAPESRQSNLIEFGASV